MIMLNLPDDVLRHIFEHLGRGHYRFIAGTCKKWEKVYRDQVNRKVIIEPKKPPAKKYKFVDDANDDYFDDPMEDDFLEEMIMYETMLLERRGSRGAAVSGGGGPRSREVRDLLMMSEAARGSRYEHRPGGVGISPASVGAVANNDDAASRASDDSIHGNGRVVPFNGTAGILPRTIFGIRRTAAATAPANSSNISAAAASIEASARAAAVAATRGNAIASLQGNMNSNDQGGSGTENDSTTSRRRASFPFMESARVQGGQGDDAPPPPSLAAQRGGITSYPSAMGNAAAVNSNAARIPPPFGPDDVARMFDATRESAAAPRGASAFATDRRSFLERLAYIERRAAASQLALEGGEDSSRSAVEAGRDIAAARRRQRLLMLFRRDPSLAMSYARSARLAAAATGERTQPGQQQERGGQNSNNNSGNEGGGGVTSTARPFSAATGRISDEDIVRALEIGDDSSLLFRHLRRRRQMNAQKQKAKKEQTQPAPDPPPTYLRTGETQTSMRSVSESVSRCKFFMSEIPEKGPWIRGNYMAREENIVNHMCKVMSYAALLGNVEVLRFSEKSVDEAKESYRTKCIEEDVQYEKWKLEQQKVKVVRKPPMRRLYVDPKLLDDRRPNVTFEVGMIAAKKGWIEVLDWMYRHRLRANFSPPWNEVTCYRAARFGRLNSVQWLRSHGCRWDSWTCAYAARYGHYELLVWAHKKGCPWDVKTTAWGAMNGHIACLKFARANKCPWNEEVCTNLGKMGRLEVLKWARSQGCPWHIDEVIKRSNRNGHQNVVDWVEQQRLQEEQQQKKK